MSNAIGSLVIDLAGKQLSVEEAELLAHPLIGGVILFTRNYENPSQLAQLCNAIRNAKKSPLLITVDQEGGRVQRFRDNYFPPLPTMDCLGKTYDTDQQKALALAELQGWEMASKILSVGIDLSLAPVLDLQSSLSPVIGDRAFHSNPRAVIALATAFIAGMNRAGMKASGKHFPSQFVASINTKISRQVEKNKGTR